MRLTPAGGIMDVAGPLGSRGLPTGGTSVSAEENKALARRFLEAQVNADLNTLHELLAPDFVDHSLQPGQEPGREDFMRWIAQLSAAVSNASVLVEDQAAEGDKVISRLTMKRTHDRGEFLASRQPEWS